MADKVNVYDIVTEKIVEQLEKGVVPWQKPWDAKYGMPRNASSGRPYSGVNVLLLAFQGYEKPLWLTYRQAGLLGGQVKKGEKSTLVVFWNFVERVDKETGKKSKIPLLRYYRVFNVAQCENLTLPKKFQNDSEEFAEIIDAEEIIKGYAHPMITFGGDVAGYSPKHDKLVMPNKESFHTPEHYYSTLFHEFGHSTGHSSRLKRFGDDDVPPKYGSEVYSEEELVAEMTSAFLCTTAGLDAKIQGHQAAYIAGWLKVLQNDTKLVVKAAGKAQKAANLILGVEVSNHNKVEGDDEEL